MTSPMEVVIKNLQEIGAFQFLFPFMLTAAVFYGLLRRSKIFGEPEKNVGVNAVVALIAAFMVWSYPVLTGVNVEVMLAKFFFQGIIATLVIIVGLLIVTTFLPGSLGEFLGEKLLRLEYEPLYEFIQPNKPAWFVIHGDFVSVEDGTGIVHIAPAFGEEDMDVGRQNNLPVLMTVEPDGKISPEIGPWAGMWVKDADPLIIKDLEERKILLGIEKIRHDYPFCWRCDTPLIYYAKPSWFIKMSEPKIKQA